MVVHVNPSTLEAKVSESEYESSLVPQVSSRTSVTTRKMLCKRIQGRVWDSTVTYTYLTKKLVSKYIKSFYKLMRQPNKNCKTCNWFITKVKLFCITLHEGNAS